MQHNKETWIWGIVLVLLGLVFLMGNFGWLNIGGNWWAIFFFIPTIGAWSGAWNQYQNNGGRMTSGVISALTWGALPGVMGLIFLFDLSWNIFWPLILIFAGISTLVSSQKRGEDRDIKRVEDD